MIDHITIPVTNLKTSIAFYEKALAPLGYSLSKKATDRIALSAGFGVSNEDGSRHFWIIEDKDATNASKYCIAFKAESKKIVEEFYSNALLHGGVCNGKPGYREQYHSGYYAAFVLDPDGYNIEAVFDE